MKAIIAARGGSKRLPRKNVRPFCGHPLIAWSIVQAKCSKYVDEVYVTTDDDEISDISREWGAKVIRRPDWEDADLAAANRPFAHAMETLIDWQFISPGDAVLTILPTTPCRFPSDFDRLIGFYLTHEVDNVHALSKMRECFVYEIIDDSHVKIFIGAKGYQYAELAFSGNVHTARWYIENQKKTPGEDHDKVLEAGLLHPVNPPIHPCIWAHPWQGVEVDTREEFEFTEIVFEHYILRGRGMSVYHDYAEGK